MKDKTNYMAFFLTASHKLEWTNKYFSTDAEAIADAKSKLRSGETVKVYAVDRAPKRVRCSQKQGTGQLAGRVVLDMNRVVLDMKAGE